MSELIDPVLPTLQTVLHTKRHVRNQRRLFNVLEERMGRGGIDLDSTDILQLIY